MRRGGQFFGRFAQPAVADVGADPAFMLEHAVQGRPRNRESPQDRFRRQVAVAQVNLDELADLVARRRLHRRMGPVLRRVCFLKAARISPAHTRMDSSAASCGIVGKAAHRLVTRSRMSRVSGVVYPTTWPCNDSASGISCSTSARGRKNASTREYVGRTMCMGCPISSARMPGTNCVDFLSFTVPMAVSMMPSTATWKT